MMPEKPIAYDIYQSFADAYSAKVETKPHNAYYDRPAMLGMLPTIEGASVLDAGCGPGVYAQELVALGANVVACDVSERMIELAKLRLGDQVELQVVDLTQPLSMFGDNQFDVVNAPLCLDYIENWLPLFQEFLRILKPGGWFQYSCGHPSFDAQYFNTQKYFSVEQVETTWSGFGEPVLMRSFRRSLEEFIMPAINAGFIVERVHEPLPTDEFRKTDLRRYKILMHRPGFLCLGARKPG